MSGKVIIERPDMDSVVIELSDDEYAIIFKAKKMKNEGLGPEPTPIPKGNCPLCGEELDNGICPNGHGSLG
ncbi:hypothetical protein L9W80_15500 [Vibrio aestuarianus]|uniref:hypothetical protein n=1 Tax=Vibrio aestuarianus TaxID=28171 RepID=UPI00237D282B|nr:hypothetical protein [Vibrio aestuarianus]MDE1351551.1 hypothetical protein [Vibrio aestuarianus]